MIKEYIEGYSYRVIFYALMLLAIIFTIVWCIFYEGNPLASILFFNQYDTFMDYYNSLHHTFLGNPYEIGCIYPPFAYLIYTVLMKMVPSDIVVQGPFAIKYSQMGQLTFMIYSIITIVTIAYIFYSNKKGRKSEKFILLFVLLLSTPMLFALERGNIVIITLLFLSIYIFYYDSTNKILREVALIALAMAVAMKIYPAVFGLLLIKEKKTKETIRCIVYGIILFFGPFFFFGGLKNVIVMFQNIFGTVNEFVDVGLGYKVNIANTLRAAAKFFHMSGQMDAFIRLSPYVLLLISLIAAFFVKEKWKCIGILAAILSIIPNFSYVYTLIFISIPLIFFLNKENKNKLDWVYSLLFVSMFAPIVFGLGRIFAPSGGVFYAYSLGTFIESMGLFLFIFLLDIEGLMVLLHRRKRNEVVRYNSSQI